MADMMRPLAFVALLWVVLPGCRQAQAQDIVYYHTDALGSPVAISDSSGYVFQRREFEPYGRQLAPAALADGPGFTGHVSDAATSLVYMQQRYYDPDLGTFYGPDPIKAGVSGGSFNRYWYANSNPYSFTDPDGREAESKGTLCSETSRCETGSFDRKTKNSRNHRQRETYSSGAPTSKIDRWMKSKDPLDRLKAAQTAVILFRIPNASDYRLVYNQYEGPGAPDAMVLENGEVQLFSGAFRSWSWLGSTLGHEMVGHDDGLPPTGRELWQSEVNAWRYNLENVRYFNNSPREVELIRDRLKFYEDCLAGAGPCR